MKIRKLGLGLSLLLNVVLLIALVWYLATGPLAFLQGFFGAAPVERAVTLFNTFSVEPGDTVFLGDSITAGGAWNELFPGQMVRNRGISGDTTEGVLARMDNIVEGRPGKLFLLIGTNDLFFDVEQADIVANILEILAVIRSESPETEIFVQSILPRAVDYKDRVESLNSTLRSVIPSYAKWIDLHPLFLDDEGVSINNSLSNDELHLLGAGYRVWQEAILEYM